MSRPSEDGGALVDVVVWVWLVGLLVPFLVAIARSPAQAARVSYSVNVAAEDGAKARGPASAQQAATTELNLNLLDGGNPRVCTEHETLVDASHLRADVVDGSPPTPGYVDVTLRCVVDGRLLTGFALPLRTTVEVHKRHVADVYRRAE